MRRNAGKISTKIVQRCADTGKKKSTEPQARKEAKYLKYNKKYPGFTPKPYLCRFCHWWHVGNAK